MSSTILYRALGFRQYQCVRTTADNGVITLDLEQDPKHDRCSSCQSPDVIRHGAEERVIGTVPIGGKPVEFAPAHTPTRLSHVRPRPSGGDPLRRALSSLQPCLRTLRAEPAVAHDHSGRRQGKVFSKCRWHISCANGAWVWDRTNAKVGARMY